MHCLDALHILHYSVLGSNSMASNSKLSAPDWIEHQEVTGWDSVEKVLTRLARDQCASAPLICGSMSKSAAHVLYTYRCAFFSKHGCKWQARVRVPRDESMIPVKPALLSQVHAQHKCVVEVAADTSHSNHFGQQDTGAHMVWKAGCWISRPVRFSNGCRTMMLKVWT